MNPVHYIIILNTIMLIISIKSETPSIYALLSKKWKISKTSAICKERIKVHKALQSNPHLQEEFCSYLDESNLDQVLPIVSKKSSSSICRCDAEEHIRDMGDNYHPRYISEHKCKQKECCEKGYCREVVYTMKVLRLQNYNIRGQFLPESLDHCFNFIQINVTVACQCS